MQYLEHYTYKSILRCTLSPTVMMIFTSVYAMVDGLFLANFAGKESFAAVSFMMPYLLIFNSVGFMFGTGGSALIAKTLGEKKTKDANEIFTNLMWVSVVTGTVLALVGYVFLEQVAVLQGATGELLEKSLLYGKIYLIGTPACFVQFEFQTLYVTSGKDKLGLYTTVFSGVLNIVLDAVFLGVFSWGIVGAAVATVISQWSGGILPFIYYGRKNTSFLSLVKSPWRGRDMLKICANGSSELVNNISVSLVSMLYNIQLLKYGGDNGIAAYGIMMYVNFLFTAVFWGYITGISPIISYHYGAENHRELHSLLKKSIVILCVSSFVMFVTSELFAVPMSLIFARQDATLFEMTVHGFYLFSFSFLLQGLSIFSASFFTALNNGPVSAFISFARVFLFQIPAIFLLPLVWDLDGVWLSVVVAEGLTLILGVLFTVFYRKKYQY